MAAIAQKTFSNAVSGMKLSEVQSKLDWNLFVPKDQIDNNLIQVMAWHINH